MLSAASSSEAPLDRLIEPVRRIVMASVLPRSVRKQKSSRMHLSGLALGVLG